MNRYLYITVLCLGSIQALAQLNDTLLIKGTHDLGRASMSSPEASVFIGGALLGQQGPEQGLWSLGHLRTGMVGNIAGAVNIYPPNGAGWMHLDNPGLPTGMVRFSTGAEPGVSADSLNVHVTQHGRIGIGVPFPLNRMDISGGGMVIGDQTAGIFSAPPNGIWTQGHLRTGRPGTQAGAVNVYPPNGAGWMHLDNPGEPTGVLRFSTGGQPGNSAPSDNMYFYQHGKLGLGTDEIPPGKMTIQYSSSVFSPHLLLFEDEETGYARINFRNQSSAHIWALAGLMDTDHTMSRFNIYHSQNGNLLSIRGDGRAGFGTTFPQNRLDVGGGMVVGASLAGNTTAPVNGLHVQGAIRTGIAGNTPGVITINSSTSANTMHIDNPGGSQGRLRISHGPTPGTSSETDNMYITENSFLGIGIASPSRPLHIFKSGDVQARIRGNTEAALELARSSAGWSIAVVNSPGGDLALEYSTNSFDSKTRHFQFWNNYFKPTVDGVVSLGQGGNRWSAVYAVEGTIQTSDAREKRNIRELQYGLDEIMQLRPVTYEWKQFPELGRHIGLIAQEVMPVLSEVVHAGHTGSVREDGTVTGASDRLGMNYSEIIPVLIRAIQEQQEMIDALQQEVSMLRAQIKVE